MQKFHQFSISWSLLFIFLFSIGGCNLKSYKTNIQNFDFEVVSKSRDLNILNEFLNNYPNSEESKKIIAYRDSALYPNFQDNKGYFIDKRDSLIYKWRRFGEQIWMTDNLKFRNQANLFFTETYSIAPEGWHIPEEEDWTKLTDYYKGNNNALNNIGWHVSDDSTIVIFLKSLPSGYCANFSGDSELNGKALLYFKKDNLDSIYFKSLSTNKIIAKHISDNIKFSVRCVKD